MIPVQSNNNFGNNNFNNNNDSGDRPRFWNFRHPERADYSDTLVGTITKIEEVQAMNWDAANSKQIPKFNKYGRPILNLRFTILEASSGTKVLFQFSQSSKGQMMQAILRAVPQLTDFDQLGGRMVRITTPDGHYDLQHPRPYTFEVANTEPDLDVWEGSVPFDYSRVQRTNAQQSNPFQGQPQPADPFQSAPQQQPQQKVDPFAKPAQQPADPFAGSGNGPSTSFYDENIPF